MINAWQENLGDMYDSEGVTNLLSRLDPNVNLETLTKNNCILVLTTGSGQTLYPAFQFENGRVIDGLAEILELLPENLISRWTLASWLVSEEPWLHSFPINALKLGKKEAVLTVARHWGRALNA